MFLNKNTFIELNLHAAHTYRSPNPSRLAGEQVLPFPLCGRS